MHVVTIPYAVSSVQFSALIFTKLLFTDDPGQLEASLRQLDQALDAGRYHLQQREASANRSSPDSTYMGYVSRHPAVASVSLRPGHVVETM